MIESLSDAQIRRYRDRVQRLIGRDVVSKAFGDFLRTNQGDPDSYYAQVYVQCQRLVDTDAPMRRLLLDPPLGRLAAALEDLGGVRLWHDQALFKQPYANPTAWHLDNPTGRSLRARRSRPGSRWTI